MKYLFLIVFLSVFSFSATGDASFSALFHDLYVHIIGNIGKFISLFGFGITFLIYLITHKGSVLFLGILLSIIIGMIIGISSLFTDIIYNFLMTDTMEGIAVYIMFLSLFILISIFHFVFTNELFSEKLKKYKEKSNML